jgi:toxin ParE1/3/4
VRRYHVLLTDFAYRQIEEIGRWIAERSSPDVATSFVERLLTRCQSLDAFPERGTPRDDIRPRLRTIPFRRRVTIGFVVEGEHVIVTGFAYRGRDLSALAGSGQDDAAAIDEASDPPR